MGRPRGFDEEDVVRSAVTIFARRPYDAVSVDELVTSLGVHRNSLYKTFGSKRGLYLAALRWHLHHQVRPLLDKIGTARDVPDAIRRALTAAAGLDLLLMATVEQAPVDPEVAGEVNQAWHDFDQAIKVATAVDADDITGALTAAVIGLRLRSRAGTPMTRTQAAGAALAALLEQRDTTD